MDDLSHGNHQQDQVSVSLDEFRDEIEPRRWCSIEPEPVPSPSLEGGIETNPGNTELGLDSSQTPSFEPANN